jgi:hypothetical protein
VTTRVHCGIAGHCSFTAEVTVRGRPQVQAWPSPAKNPEWRDATPDRIQPEGARGHTTCDRRPLTPPPAAIVAVMLVACPRFEPSNRGLLVGAVRGLSRPDVPPFARICKTFRNRRPRSASTGSQAGEPTPICRVGCGVLSFLLPVTPEAAGSSPVDPRLHKSALDDPSRQSFATTPPTSLASLETASTSQGAPPSHRAIGK